MLLFFSPTCPDCGAVDAEILPQLEDMVGPVERINVDTEKEIEKFLAVSTALDLQVSHMAPLLVYRGKAMSALKDMRTFVAEQRELYPE